jgi:hypothetical protein
MQESLDKSQEMIAELQGSIKSMERKKGYDQHQSRIKQIEILVDLTARTITIPVITT